MTVSTTSCVSARSGADEPDEADTGDQTGAAEQDERREAVELGLVGRRQGAGDSDGPDDREREIECRLRRASDR